MILITETEQRTVYHTDVNGFTKHRPNGPASIWKITSSYYWYLRGASHRYYGPQTITGGREEWCIHGQPIK